MTQLIGPLSILDRIITGYFLGATVDAAAKVCERFTPSLCPISEDTQKTILSWTGIEGRKELKDYSTLHWGHWGAPFEYVATARILFARHLHAFVLGATTGKKTIDAVVADITGKAVQLGQEQPRVTKETFRRAVQKLIDAKISNNVDGLSYTKLGVYLGKESVKYLASGALRLGVLHYFVGRHLPNMLYQTTMIASIALWTLPLVASSRRELSTLKGPNIDKANDLLDSKTKEAIVAKAQEIFQIQDSDNAGLLKFKNDLNNINLPPQSGWPFAHISFSVDKAKEIQALPVKVKGTNAEPEAIPAKTKDEVKEERAALKAIAKPLADKSEEKLRATIEVIKHAIANAKVLELTNQEIKEKKADLADKLLELEKMKTARKSSSSSSSSSSSAAAPLAKIEVSDDES